MNPDSEDKPKPAANMRTPREIANDIERYWDDVDTAIIPYLIAMKYLKDYQDSYMGMSAERIIDRVYFYIRDWTYEKGIILRAELRNIRRELRNNKH